ncbi:THO complex subunit 3 [Zancudomyces culisetae]|uniref:THO complex subunit 3 n=1 Tax=Zancudomyces culisetae TaxID=1213189 RepID=A0A1R1PIF0_ZANCU|nr:THO complex subunit 3 [Zancudomyces culisetae]|eukprot:OMH80726.1 THO complex subunit 3 [Zancudomyces culisetae]
MLQPHRSRNSRYYFTRQNNSHLESYSCTKLFVATGKGAIQELSVPEFDLKTELVAHTSNCYSLDIDSSGKYLASGASDALALLWCLQTNICVKAFDELEYPIRSLGFSFDGRFLATSSEDKLVNIHEIDHLAFSCVEQIKVKSAMNAISWHSTKYVLAFAGDEPFDKSGSEYVVKLFVPR